MCIGHYEPANSSVASKTAINSYPITPYSCTGVYTFLTHPP